MCSSDLNSDGAKPPKGQELDDHYFGAIKPTVAAFMEDLNEELWKLGILAKTEHNEVAPAQHELAPIYTTTNIATDHNQLTMEIMQKVAARHGLVCLLHEKPFAGVNGSGKHNNWSISTDEGVNLLSPGETPHDNAQFLLFLTAVIKAVDEHQDLLRLSVATAGNDHRLGANEAPPAIISIFLGDELTEILKAIEEERAYSGKEKELMKVGAHVLPKFPKDATDRNRTSPFAFTGNKFEFRMPGSSASISGANIVLNTVVADELRQFADVLEIAPDLPSAVHALIKDTIHGHHRIIFNGNGYDDAWIEEAKKRGLLNLRTTPDALPYFIREENIRLFESHGVFDAEEMHSRYEIMMEEYVKTLHIEAQTMIDMTAKQILPAVSRQIREWSDTLCLKRQVGEQVDTSYEAKAVAMAADLQGAAFASMEKLKEEVASVQQLELEASAAYYRDVILTRMEELRLSCDALETMTSAQHWPFPTYGKLLFGIL